VQHRPHKKLDWAYAACGDTPAKRADTMAAELTADRFGLLACRDLDAGKTCEVDFAVTGRLGNLSYEVVLVCSSDPATLPSATRSNLTCQGSLTTFAASAGSVIEETVGQTLTPCQLSVNGALESCDTAGAASCSLPFVGPAPSLLEYVDPANDPFGQPTQATCRQRGSTYLVNPGAGPQTVSFNETCDADAQMTLTANGVGGAGEPTIGVAAGTNPTIAWDASPGLG
jgi:hypothetical protein